MINKLLCFMFGHVFEKIHGHVVIESYFGKKYTHPVTIEKCKFCNAREP